MTWIASGASVRAVSITCLRSARPASGSSTFGSADFMRLPSPAARITTDRGNWVRPPPLRSGAEEWLGFLATVDALPLAAGGDKHDSPPDRDRAGLGPGRAQAKLAELAAHEGPDVHLGIRLRLLLRLLAPRPERAGPAEPLPEGSAPGKRVL